jgi:hypothetical protein
MSALWCCAALLAWVVLPGIATAAVVGRGSEPVQPVRVLSVALSSGLVVWFLGSEALARLNLMSSTGAVAATVVVAVASLGVIGGPGRPGLKLLRREPVLVELAVMLVASVVVALPLLVLVARRTDSLTGPTPWYYLDLARSVIQHHGVPATSPEWATRLPFLDDYPAFTSGTALLLAVGGVKSMAAAQAVRMLTLVAVGAGAYLFARAFGAARSAAAVSIVVLFVSTTYVGKLASYRPEAAGYALVFVAGALAKLWLDHRRNVDLALVTVALLALSEVHGIGWLFGAMIVGGLAVGYVIFSPERRAALRASGLLVGFLIGGWLIGNLVLGGGLSGANKLGGLPPSNGGDPTWRFVNLVAGRIAPRPAPSATDAARKGMSRGFINLGAWWYLVVVVVVVILLIVVAWIGRATLRRAAREYSAMALLVVLGCTAVSVWFAVRWSTYVPTRTGWGRVFPLTFALLPAAIAIVLSALSSRRLRLVAAALVLVLGAAAMVHARDYYRQLDHQQPTRDTLTSMRALKLGPKDLVLTNAYSEGYVGAVPGGKGVLDGRAPYSEPKTLKRANQLLEQSISFFADPVNQPLPTDAKGIDYVLVATDPSVLGTPLVFSTSYGALMMRPDLKLVHSGPGYLLYKVTPAKS